MTNRKGQSNEEDELYERGADLVHSFDRDLIELGVSLLRKAFEGGNRSAGYQLAALPGHIDPDSSGLTRKERAELLEEHALSGYPSAALNLYYLYNDLLPIERIRAALSAAASNSSEAKDLLERI